MLKTMIISVGAKKAELYEYLTDITEKSKNLRNVATFYFRNLYTGLGKDAHERYPLEEEVIRNVTEELTKHNAVTQAKRDEFLSSQRYISLPEEEKERAYKDFCKRHGFYQVPDKENRAISCEALITVLQSRKDPDYYALPGQVNQRAVRKSRDAWKSGMACIAKWKKEPSLFKGRPTLPKYIKSTRSTASFSSQICKFKKEKDGKWYLSFPKTDCRLCLGHREPEGKLQAVEAVPAGEHYDIMITCEVPDVEKKSPHPAGERIYALDPGVNNFMAVAGNFEMVPFLMDGRYLKSMNQLYNKRKAGIMTEAMKGKENRKGGHIAYPPEMDRISDKRDRFLRDTFYKMAHYICRRAEREGVTLLVAGKTRYWKQESGMKDKENQNFVQLPHARFFNILKITAEKYGIRYEEQEESYTSKADFLSGDPIPVYGEEGAEKIMFSGRRMHRGLYRTNNGTILNADVNGAANILRKHLPEAFANVKDFGWLNREVERITYRILQPKPSR